MKASLLFFGVLFLSIQSFSQISIDQLKLLKPRNIGPAGMSGRITAVDVVNNHQDTWYVGSASGGVWKTTNAGGSWNPVFDEQQTLNIGSIAVQQNNPSIVWVGTGEGNPRNSLNLGEGIYKSMDAGKT
ncbi:MAG: WD40/YVTN/BNR-like repeat-containing protein, partial [Flavisolibacter sp.]